MRRTLVGTRDEPMAFRHFADRASSFGKRIGFRFLDGRMKSLPYSLWSRQSSIQTSASSSILSATASPFMDAIW